MQTQEQVVPIRTPESSFDDEVVTVIGPDGKVRSEADPKLPVEQVLDLYKAMVRTRIIDTQLERLQRQGRIGFHIGSLGEEACIIGSAAAMRPQDWIFPCYREFGALLWRGFPLQSYVDNMFGNAEDIVMGRQMPDHYSGKKYHFGSVSSPIGTQMSQAVGFGWAAKKKGEDTVVSVYFGEGATSSNDFHTGMNFAGVMEAPVVFLCRNNRWAISVPSEKQTASKTFADKGQAYGVPAVRVDGNDFLATYAVVRECVEKSARGEGPFLVEMLTYRIGGHSTSDDPRAYRMQDEVESWRRTDPLVRARAHLDVLDAWSDAEDETFKSETEAELKECIAKAEAKPKPALSTMFDGVYAEKPWHLKEQQEACENGPRAKEHH
ncbi:MAG: 3-methyl-2-oxobutanoate dehydrogenase [Sandaracinus sp.]|nr:3-methyl-2-oxobutanoate dehydrogenase [Sandaracinus sp.]|tara:strand:- start:2534 stop:3670 length:1137 start_codon:yes stop_codon:yes gene_type:complete